MIYTVAQVALTLLAIIVSLTMPRLINAPVARVERFARPLWASHWRVIVTVMLVAFTLRALLLPLVGPAVPLVHDENSLLLQAQTYLTGAFAAPAHPLWRHFESIHVNVLPTYSSIYFPGRGAPMAAGLLLAGDPWVGVWLSMILMCGAISWMLLGWVRPSLALLGGLIVVIRFGVFSYWVNGFFGGAFTTLGAALVLGALPRLLRRADWRNGFALGVGALILMTTRPFEGLLFCLPVAAILLWRSWRHISRRDYAPVLRMAVPAAACVALGLAIVLSANAAATGDALTTSYDLNRARYAIAPAMLTADPITPASSPGVQFDAFYAWEKIYHDRRSSMPGIVSSTYRKLSQVIRFYIGLTLALPFLIGGIMLLRRGSPAIWPGLFVIIGFLFTTWDLPHYVSPVLAVIILAIVEGLDRLRRWEWRGRRTGAALSRSLPIVGAVVLAIPVSSLATGYPVVRNNHLDAACCSFKTRTAQTPVAAKLKATPGRDLVIVRYRDQGVVRMASHIYTENGPVLRQRVHSAVRTEWVYNEPYPDSAEIVWARDLGPARNAELRRYYADRVHWLAEDVNDRSDGRLRLLSSPGNVASAN